MGWLAGNVKERREMSDGFGRVIEPLKNLTDVVVGDGKVALELGILGLQTDNLFGKVQPCSVAIERPRQIISSMQDVSDSIVDLGWGAGIGDLFWMLFRQFFEKWEGVFEFSHGVKGIMEFNLQFSHLHVAAGDIELQCWVIFRAFGELSIEAMRGLLGLERTFWIVKRTL